MDLNLITKDIDLSENELFALNFIINNIEILQDKTLKDISKLVFISPPSIVRLCKKLGFKGYIDFYYYLTHKANVQDNNQDIMFNQPKYFEISKLDFSDNHKNFLSNLKKEINSSTRKSVIICATGFSGILAKYLYKKLLVQGKSIIFSGGEDSSGIIEKNLGNISLFIGFSKSGETNSVIKKAKLCNENGIPTFIVTGNFESRLYYAGQQKLVIKDDLPLDSQNICQNNYFVRLMYIIEVISNLKEPIS